MVTRRKIAVHTTANGGAGRLGEYAETGQKIVDRKIENSEIERQKIGEA